MEAATTKPSINNKVDLNMEEDGVNPNGNVDALSVSIASSPSSFGKSVTTSPRLSWFSSGSNPAPSDCTAINNLASLNQENFTEMETSDDDHMECNTDPLSTSTPKISRELSLFIGKPGPMCSKRKKSFPLSLSLRKRPRRGTSKHKRSSSKNTPKGLTSRDNLLLDANTNVTSMPAMNKNSAKESNSLTNRKPEYEIPANFLHDGPSTSKDAAKLLKLSSLRDSEDKIPAIFLYNITTIQPLLDSINSIPGVMEKNFITTTLNGNRIKIMCKNSTTYQLIMNQLETENKEIHTHQSKSDRGYRVIIRRLHHSTPYDLIRNHINNLGFTVRYINNIKHRRSHKPLDLFEVELAPSLDNSNVLYLRKPNPVS
ncbi:uncharacterized protein [Drosophila bipectinata]|uniref:uncharacterized protein n=1 Tax=Drosophila bipectinata TaxID=42026 RepID=UPI0038B3948E